MPITPETEEAPADHPIHRGLIIFGWKPRDSSKRPSSSPPDVLPPDPVCDGGSHQAVVDTEGGEVQLCQ